MKSLFIIQRQSNPRACAAPSVHARANDEAHAFIFNTKVWCMNMDEREVAVKDDEMESPEHSSSESEDDSDDDGLIAFLRYAYLDT